MALKSELDKQRVANYLPTADATTDGIVTTGSQTFSGSKTFTSSLVGSITGNAATVTNGVYTTSDQTLGGNKTFSGTTSFNSSVSVDTINEKTSANGVLIDGVRCKDSNVIGNRIILSLLQSLSFTGSLGQTFDTGLPINMGGGGGTALVLFSINTSSGVNTQSGVGYIKFYYDGNNLPTLTVLSGNIYLTLSASGSNTLVLTNNVGGNSYTTLLLNK